MFIKKIALAALAGSTLLAAAPAFADGNRGNRHDYRGDRFQNHRGHHHQRHVTVHRHVPYYAHRRFVVQRPVVVYRQPYAHQVLGGLILGTVIGTAIANQAGGDY